jgi:hypothetical protein
MGNSQDSMTVSKSHIFHLISKFISCNTKPSASQSFVICSRRRKPPPTNEVQLFLPYRYLCVLRLPKYRSKPTSSFCNLSKSFQGPVTNVLLVLGTQRTPSPNRCDHRREFEKQNNLLPWQGVGIPSVKRCWRRIRHSEVRQKVRGFFVQYWFHVPFMCP